MQQNHSKGGTSTSVKIGSGEISCSIFNENLSFAAHITKKCKSVSWNLKRIRMICSMLDKESCEVLVCSLALSHLDYVNGNLYGVANYSLKRMQRIQNYVARVILQVDKKCDSLQALFELHWLPIKAHIECKLLCIIHKCLHCYVRQCSLDCTILFEFSKGLASHIF